MKTYQPHPASEIFPMMSEVEYQKLKADIDANGIRTSIKLLGETADDCLVLDGRNRLRAVQELDLDIWDSAELIHPEDMPDPVAFVLSLNLHRRHLTESERAMVAGRIANLKHGGTGANQHKGADSSIELSATSQSEAAAQLNVSVASVKRAAKVQQEAVPDLVTAVERGNVSVSAAETVSHLPKPAQQKLIDAGPAAVKAEAAKIRKAKQPATKPKPEPSKSAKPVSVETTPDATPLRDLKALFNELSGPDRIAVMRFVDWAMNDRTLEDVNNGCQLWLDLIDQK